MLYAPGCNAGGLLEESPGCRGYTNILGYIFMFIVYSDLDEVLSKEHDSKFDETDKFCSI